MAPLTALLLLLVSLQAYAGVCSVRCGVMDSGSTRDSSRAMANCRGMSMNYDAHVTKALLSPVKSCTELCQSDLKLLQSRISHNLDGQLPAVGIVSALGNL